MLVLDLIAAGIIALLVVFLAIYVLCRYSASEEDGEAWLPRVVVVLAICVACYIVLLLPLEVALMWEEPSLDLTWAWQVLLGCAYALLFVAGPYAFVNYESWSPSQTNVWSQVRPALGTVLALNTIFLLFFAALWVWGCRVDGTADTIAKLPVFDYFVATVSVFGWFFFFLFAGVGLAAVPVNGICAFAHRPRPISSAEYELTRVKLNMEVQHLLARGRRLEGEVKGAGQTSQRQRQRMALFKRDVREVESQTERNETAFNLSGGVIVRAYVMLSVALLNAVMSILWVLHILLSNILSIYPLLDEGLDAMDDLLPMLATLVYTYAALYLMWCTISGCHTAGSHLLAAPVFPLRVRATMLNALLFNALAVLCASFAVLHLCVVSFPSYAGATSMHQIFTITIARMRSVHYVSQYLQCGLLLVFLLSVPWLLFCPRFLSRSMGSDEDADDEEAGLL